jgi:long-chain acyl-CoA synthetase
MVTETVKPLHEYLRDFARVTPNKPAIIFYGRQISFKELDELSDRFANFLLQNGIGKGDKVALFMQNCPQYLICHYGIQKIGAIVGPCSPMFKEWELEYEVKDLGAKAIIVLDHLFPIVEAIRSKTSLGHVIVTNYSDFLPGNPAPAFPEELIPKQKIQDTHDLQEILQTSSPVPPKIDINPYEDVGLIVYTSGSTGLPKGAMLTYHNALFKTECVAKSFGYTAEDVYLCVMPVFHIAGMLIGVNSPVYSGGTIVLLTRFTPEAVLEVINTHRISVAYTIVPMNVAMMNHPKAAEVNFSSLRMNACTSFGIQLTEEISEAWKKVTGVGLFETAYGLSETHTADSLMPPEQVKFGTVGKPTLETEIKIVSLEDPTVEVPVGEQGEIVVKNPGVFKGYLNKPEATEKTLRDGWVYTGDIGKFDEDGYLYFIGRVKEMIKCSGYSVFPEDVEVMLVRNPAISAAAVIGVPDPVRGETVKAFIVLKPEYEGKITAEEIISWSKEKMADYKYPRHLEFRSSLPTTGTGKLLRRLLVDEEQAKKSS